MVHKRVIPKLGEAPKASNPKVSKTMKGNVGKGTKLEKKFIAILEGNFKNTYLSNVKSLPGTPDIVLSEPRLAIFINGCFWHHCPKCYPGLPKTHTDFWRRKFVRNEERDKRKIKELKRLGWKVRVFWEHDINRDPDKIIKTLKLRLNNQSTMVRKTMEKL